MLTNHRPGKPPSRADQRLGIKRLGIKLRIKAATKTAKPDLTGAALRQASRVRWPS